MGSLGLCLLPPVCFVLVSWEKGWMKMKKMGILIPAVSLCDQAKLVTSLHEEGGNVILLTAPSFSYRLILKGE